MKKARSVTAIKVHRPTPSTEWKEAPLSASDEVEDSVFSCRVFPDGHTRHPKTALLFRKRAPCHGWVRSFAVTVIYYPKKIPGIS